MYVSWLKNPLHATSGKQLLMTTGKSCHTKCQRKLFSSYPCESCEWQLPEIHAEMGSPASLHQIIIDWYSGLWDICHWICLENISTDPQPKCQGVQRTQGGSSSGLLRFPMWHTSHVIFISQEGSFLIKRKTDLILHLHDLQLMHRATSMITLQQYILGFNPPNIWYNYLSHYQFLTNPNITVAIEYKLYCSKNASQHDTNISHITSMIAYWSCHIIPWKYHVSDFIII